MALDAMDDVEQQAGDPLYKNKRSATLEFIAHPKLRKRRKCAELESAPSCKEYKNEEFSRVKQCFLTVFESVKMATCCCKAAFISYKN